MCAKTEKENLFEVKLLPLVLYIYIYIYIREREREREREKCNYHSVCDHNTTLTL